MKVFECCLKKSCIMLNYQLQYSGMPKLQVLNTKADHMGLEAFSPHVRNARNLQINVRRIAAGTSGKPRAAFQWLNPVAYPGLFLDQFGVLGPIHQPARCPQLLKKSPWKATGAGWRVGRSDAPPTPKQKWLLAGRQITWMACQHHLRFGIQRATMEPALAFHVTSRGRCRVSFVFPALPRHTTLDSDVVEPLMDHV